MKTFLLAPFIAIKETWKTDNFGKWLIITALPAFLVSASLVSWIVYSEIKNAVVHRTISSGVVVDRWFEPSHDRFVGKRYINIPERLHVTLRGKNWFGYENERDVIVSPENWTKMQIGTTWNFE